MNAPRIALVWFRDDLRIADNPALVAALGCGGPVVACFVLDEESPGIRPRGGAARWWLHHSLLVLALDLASLGIELILRRGSAADVVPQVASQVGASAVFWNRRYGREEREVDSTLKTDLRAAGMQVESHAASLLFEPWTVRTNEGLRYCVFTPFWKACRRLPTPREPLSRPTRPVSSHIPPVDYEGLDSFDLLPRTPDWSGGLRATWTPGEASAHRMLGRFLDESLDGYAAARDIPGHTSGLSPHLRFGEISPFQVWHAVSAAEEAGAQAGDVERFLTEVGWREFAWHTLYHFPGLATRNWRADFDAFEWPPLDKDLLRAWQTGRTGYGLVDAGMRELWGTGTMAGRVRMVTASFLTKNLLIDWRVGEQWFWDTLVDADAASNAFNWQWVAGSGVDAAPYFRVFNPELQARKFDPQETYVRTFVPEWGGPGQPPPVVDLQASRAQALALYGAIRGR